MENISDILKRKTYIQAKPKQRQLNLFYKPTYYMVAKEFGDYVGLKTSFILKLFKKYGIKTVLQLRSFLKDYPADKRGLYGIIIWKLKQLNYCDRSSNDRGRLTDKPISYT